MTHSRALAAGIPLLFSFLSVGLLFAAEKRKPEEIVAAHLEQAGPADARARPRVARGAATLASAVAGVGQLAGSFEMSSDAVGARLLLRFGTDAYEGETFAFDGKDVEVGFGQRPTGRRSALGTFIAENPVILCEGLLGGVLNASWPLAALDARQAKVSSEGTKKLDGRELVRLGYRAKRGQNDLTIQLYFEPDTLRHVASVYSASRAQSQGASPEASSRESDTYYRLEERFSDFESRMGLTLPRRWTLRYEISSRATSEWKYELEVREAQPR